MIIGNCEDNNCCIINYIFITIWKVLIDRIYEQNDIDLGLPYFGLWSAILCIFMLSELLVVNDNIILIC